MSFARFEADSEVSTGSHSRRAPLDHCERTDARVACRATRLYEDIHHARLDAATSRNSSSSATTRLHSSHTYGTHYLLIGASISCRAHYSGHSGNSSLDTHFTRVLAVLTQSRPGRELRSSYGRRRPDATCDKTVSKMRLNVVTLSRRVIARTVLIHSY